eukprot:TRINITY_DN8951_c0_g1_i1.p1 TRINITY_DN8951_c0_g1~~TRINITY_DN8951_c0_g1_i1.p1  ORF type:complete len:412 (+),score=80.79 TRINITY_DN8951_c0_g1_i1:79-1314(+)
MEFGEEYSRTRVWQIYEWLYPKPPDLVDGDRFFVREGELFVWSEKDKKKKKRYFFLFNDVMLLCKREGNKKFWLRVHITLRSQFVSVEDTGSYDPLEFRLRCRTRTFLFWALSPENKKTWMRDIDASVKGKHEINVKKQEHQKKNAIESDKPKLEPLKPIETKSKSDTVPVLPPPPGQQRRSSSVSLPPPTISSVRQAPTTPTPSAATTQNNANGQMNLIDLLDFNPFEPQPAPPVQSTPQPLNPFSQISQPQPNVSSYGLSYGQQNSNLVSATYAGPSMIGSSYGQPTASLPLGNLTQNSLLQPTLSSNAFGQTYVPQTSYFGVQGTGAAPGQVFGVRSMSTPLYAQTAGAQNPFGGQDLGYQVQTLNFQPVRYPTVQGQPFVTATQGFPNAYPQNQQNVGQKQLLFDMI